MPISPAALHRLGQLSRTPAALAFARAARDPVAAQRRVLRRLLEANAHTEYGRRHGFASIATPADFAAQVPVMTPEDLQVHVRRVMAGEREILSAGAPLAYATTTGSTGPAKYVPLTAEYKAEFQRTVHVSMWHLYRRFPDAFTGRVLYFVGPRRAAVAPDGHDIGTMSGFNYTELPPLVRRLYAWPYELVGVSDPRARAHLSLHLACVRDVSLLAGVFPATIVQTLRALVERRDELAFHIERGTLPADLALSPAQRTFFAGGLAPRPDVAARLRQIRGDDDAVRLAFPRLRLVYCWLTSTAGLFVPELRRRLGSDIPLRDAIYSASEGWCSVPMGDEAPGGAVAITSHYFEFIPEESGVPVPVEGLRDGGRYYILISNSAGVWRYLLGDLIEVCGFYENTPRIRFVRKAGAASNLVGELLEEAHVNRALVTAMAWTGTTCEWCALAPRPDAPVPAYDLLVEGAAVTDAFAAAVDEALAAEAQRYGVLRRGGSLAPLRLVRIPLGSAAAWRRRLVDAGAGEAQIKTAHLVDAYDRLPPELRPERGSP